VSAEGDLQGQTELLLACAFESETPGVGPNSFTAALIQEIKRFKGQQSFTVGWLYRNLLQCTLKPLYRNPIHVILTRGNRRSIELSVLDPVPSSDDQRSTTSASPASSQHDDSSTTSTPPLPEDVAKVLEKPAIMLQLNLSGYRF
jgi:hypothetical protein